MSKLKYTKPIAVYKDDYKTISKFAKYETMSNGEHYTRADIIKLMVKLYVEKEGTL
jgi:type I restriction-modification system DNA methylase subunit